MIPKLLDQIEAADLRRLIEEGICESKTIEYKRDFPTQADGGNVKILRSISSFANTAGGDLLYGIEAKDGIPVAAVGLVDVSEDQIKQRLENLCREGLQPRIPNLQVRLIQASDNPILLIRVQKSWQGPHRVIANGHAHFYGRNSAGVYPLDVGELRTAFTLSATVTERILAFRAGRMASIAANETPITPISGAKFVMQSIPLESFSNSQTLIDIQSHHEFLSRIAPISATSFSDRINLEGVLVFQHGREMVSRCWTQYYRSGVIESVVVIPDDDGKRVIYGGMDRYVLTGLEAHLRVFKQLQINPPLFFMLTLCGVKGWTLNASTMRTFFPEQYPPVDRDILVLPEVVIENTEKTSTDIVKPLLDALWNSFGFIRSFSYDPNGKWVDNP